MTAPPLPWRTLRLTIFLGSFLGAVLSFFYFRVVDPEVVAAAGAVRVTDVLVSLAAFGSLAGAGYVLGRRWLDPLVSAPSNEDAARDPVVRHRAVLVPYAFASLTLAGWVLAGVIWGVVWPTITGGFNPRLSLRLFFGITVIAGTVATVFAFLAAEYYWRRAMPLFFPHGDVSLVPSALRLPVRLRLLGIFLLISIIPLTILGTLAYNSVQALLHVDPQRAAALAGSLGPLILFIVAVGVLAAIGLAAPLRQIEEAMAAVGRGELDTRCPVVTNDEIGAVAEGFNRMLEGLQERERIRETFGRYVTREIRDEILAGRASFEG